MSLKLVLDLKNKNKTQFNWSQEVHKIEADDSREQKPKCLPGNYFITTRILRTFDNLYMYKQVYFPKVQ